jgi:hypothetical protein
MKKLENYIKYYNIFSFLYFKYFLRKNVSLLGMHRHSNNLAEAARQSASWWDVFDGIMWICSFVATLFAIGLVRHFL